VHYFLFLLYLVVFSFLITRIKFFTNSGINKFLLVALFAIKIFAGLAYAWFYLQPNYHTNSDSFRFYAYSLEETNILLTQPLHFFKDIFSYGYTTTGNVFVGDNSYWNDLKSNIIIKLLAVCNVFSFKNYFINIIFFNFFFFFGLIGFYRVMQSVFTDKKYILIIPVFLIPSFLFWCSGIHKDGLIFSAIGLVFYFFHQLLQKKFFIKYFIFIILLLALLFFLRNYVALALMIALFTWFIATKTKKIFLVFVSIYLLVIAAFFIVPKINTQLNFPEIIVLKQQDFSKLTGGSEVVISKLQPNFKSFVQYFPHALDMAFVRPHITELKNKSYIPAIAEIILFFIVLIFSIIYRNKNFKIQPIVFASIFFSLTLLIIAGYTVTFSGAIVRYRSLALPFLLTPLIGFLDWNKVNKIFKQSN